MTNTVVLNEFFIWGEKNLIEPKMKSKNNGVIDQEDITKNIRTLNESENWKDITDPKLREKAYNKAYNKAYREANREKAKEYKKVYREINRDKILKYNREYKSLNIESVKLYEKNYRSNNKEKIKSYFKNYFESNSKNIKIKQKSYYITNKNKIRLRQKLYSKTRLDTDVQYKLSVNLRARLRSALKNHSKSGSAVKDLGCTIEDLKVHLESKFQPGMLWSNYGEWHIDHIKPLASFDLSDRKQLLEACHYTNLQPLWAQDNLSKSDKVL